jgi:capsule polysaccharide export protein KpsE/RkpR
MKNDYIPYRIEVGASDPWMQREITVSLVTQLTEHTSTGQSFTLDTAESIELANKLLAYAKEAPNG